jgi:hypothetical protein
MPITMTREFTRVAWASEVARAVWEPRVQAISKAWLDVEIESVKKMIRPCALVFGKPADLGGLTAIEVVPGRFAVGRSIDAQCLADAYAAGNDQRIGGLLGFPACCRQFFDHVWNVEKKRDTTLAMGGHGHIHGPLGANILGRWLGVRCVPHLPCRWDCEHTCEFAALLDPLWPSLVREWRDEILSWPIKYSALHGVAIITMPVVRVVTDTDYTPAEQTIKREGFLYPTEAPSGLGFPFKRKSAAGVISLASLRTDPREWIDNGFQTRAVMDAAHDMVLAALPEDDGLEVVDLGCGNGRLLRRIPACFKVGVECDAERAARGRAAGLDVREGLIQDLAALVPETFGLALVSERRIEELSMNGQIDTFRAWLRTHVADVVLYSYDVPRFARRIPASAV